MIYVNVTTSRRLPHPQANEGDRRCHSLRYMIRVERNINILINRIVYRHNASTIKPKSIESSVWRRKRDFSYRLSILHRHKLITFFYSPNHFVHEMFRGKGKFMENVLLFTSISLWTSIGFIIRSATSLSLWWNEYQNRRRWFDFAITIRWSKRIAA